MSPTRRKPVSAKRARRISQNVNNATIGTHVSGPRRASRSGMEGPMGFASARRSARATRGELMNVGAASTTRETAREQSRRQGQLSFAQETQRSSVLKRIVAVVVLVAVVVAVGVGVGTFVFYQDLGNRFALDGNDVPSGLTTAKTGEAYYLVVNADLDKSNGNNDVDALELVRVDESTRKMTIISIPTNLTVTLSDLKEHPISEAVDLGGSSELVSQVAKFAGVSIAHYVKTDEDGIRTLVNAMGGLHLNVAEEVDDPEAGSIYIPAGEQTLNADQAMVFLRAQNYKESTTTREANQALVLAMGVEYFAGDGTGVEGRMEDATGAFKCDMSGDSLLNAFKAFAGFQAANAWRASVPGYTNEANGDGGFTAYTSSWTQMMDQVDAGESPVIEERGTFADIYPGAYTVTVRNGSGIDGGASSVANQLSGLGFKVKETGNTDSYVYDETLVIYGNDSLKPGADAIVDVLNCGRTAEAGVYYTYSTDLLVIIGSDWTPSS